MTNKRVCTPLVASIVCSVLLLPGALFLPIGDPANLAYTLNGHTVNIYVPLVTINGPGVLWIVALPLVLTLVATCLMLLQLRTRSPSIGWMVIGIGALILAGAFVGTITFLIGAFAAPSGILLLLAEKELRRMAPHGVGATETGDARY